MKKTPINVILPLFSVLLLIFILREFEFVYPCVSDLRAPPPLNFSLKPLNISQNAATLQIYVCSMSYQRKSKKNYPPQLFFITFSTMTLDLDEWLLASIRLSCILIPFFKNTNFAF